MDIKERLQIGEYFRILNDNERAVLLDRFGFNSKAMTLEAIAKKKGITRERVRQIEKTALEKFELIDKYNNYENTRANKKGI
jgi:RNA polymerase primary sigma factor